MASPQARSPLTPHCIYFIDKDNAGRILFGLFKQVAHPGSTHAHKHLHKIGTADGEKGHTSLPGYRPGHQCLTRTRRSK